MQLTGCLDANKICSLVCLVKARSRTILLNLWVQLRCLTVKSMFVDVNDPFQKYNVTFYIDRKSGIILYKIVFLLLSGINLSVNEWHTHCCLLVHLLLLALTLRRRWRYEGARIILFQHYVTLPASRMSWSCSLNIAPAGTVCLLQNKAV